MAKVVMSAGMVAHTWAAQSQEKGRLSSYNFHFNGENLFSYRLRIARSFKHEGVSIIFFLSGAETASHTTTMHLSMARNATHHILHRFTVPYLDQDSDTHAHSKNLEYLVNKYKSDWHIWNRRLLSSELRWRSVGKNQLTALALNVYNYAATFGIPPHEIDYQADITQINERFERLRAQETDPETLARREKARARREVAKDKAAELARLSLEDKAIAWKAGQSVLLPPGGFKTPGGGAYLRVKGEHLQTSQGASVPLGEAIRVFADIKRMLAARITAPFTVSQRIGSFRVDVIYPNGDIRARCHLIEFAESTRIATQLGIDVGLAPASSSLRQTPAKVE